MTAPERLFIHDFTVDFNFYLGTDKQVLLDLVFDYGSQTVTSREELRNLPFASNFEREQQVFKAMLEAGLQMILSASVRLYDPKKFTVSSLS